MLVSEHTVRNIGNKVAKLKILFIKVAKVWMHCPIRDRIIYSIRY